MEATVEARIGWNHIPSDLSRYDVFGAVEGCDDVGREFLVQHDGQWLLGLAVDCAGDIETVEWMQQARVLVEVSWPTAVSWGTVGRLTPVNFAYVEQEIIPGSTSVVAI